MKTKKDSKAAKNKAANSKKSGRPSASSAKSSGKGKIVKSSDKKARTSARAAKSSCQAAEKLENTINLSSGAINKTMNSCKEVEEPFQTAHARKSVGRKTLPTLKYFDHIPVAREKRDSLSYVWQGARACAMAALEAGVDFFAGYPITPSTEIAEVLSEELPKRGHKFIQMEDEIGSITALIGASLAGAQALTATSGPGFSLMQEALGYAMVAEIPLVIVNVMRGGPSTGLPTRPSQGDVMQSRWGTHGDHESIVLAPCSVPEIYAATIKAFNLAETLRHPVILLLDEILAHMREPINPVNTQNIENRQTPNMPPDWYQPFKSSSTFVPKMAPLGEGYRFHVTGLIHDESGFPTIIEKEVAALLSRLNKKIADNRDKVVMSCAYMTNDADEILFAYGSTARSAFEAVHRLRKMGKKVGLFRPITIWPFPSLELIHSSQKAKRIYVCEMNMGQMMTQVTSVLGARLDVQGLNRFDGDMIKPEQIIQAVLDKES